MVDWIVYNRYADNRGDLAIRIGYNPTVLSAALTGRIPFSDKLARTLCQHFKRLNYDWLVRGEGEMLLPETAPADKGAERSADPGNKTAATPQEIPDTADTGTAKGAPYYPNLNVSGGQLEMYGYNNAREHIYIPGVDAEAFFPVIGMSMEPNIKQGDIIGVRSVSAFEMIDPERVYMIITRSNERMIKHIMPNRAEDEELTLTSDNSDFAPFSILKEDVLKVMRVVYVGRML